MRSIFHFIISTLKVDQDTKTRSQKYGETKRYVERKYHWISFSLVYIIKCQSCTPLILINIFNKRNTFKTNLMQINNCTIMVSNENLDAKCSVQMVVTMPTCGWIARILKVSGENGSVKPNLVLKARRGFVIAELLVPVTLILPSKTNGETIKK